MAPLSPSSDVVTLGRTAHTPFMSQEWSKAKAIAKNRKYKLWTPHRLFLHQHLAPRRAQCICTRGRDLCSRIEGMSQRPQLTILDPDSGSAGIPLPASNPLNFVIYIQSERKCQSGYMRLGGKMMSLCKVALQSHCTPYILKLRLCLVNVF